MPRFAFKLLVSLVLLWPALSSALTTETSADAEDSTVFFDFLLSPAELLLARVLKHTLRKA